MGGYLFSTSGATVRVRVRIRVRVSVRVRVRVSDGRLPLEHKRGERLHHAADITALH